MLQKIIERIIEGTISYNLTSNNQIELLCEIINYYLLKTNLLNTKYFATKINVVTIIIDNI